MYDIHIGNVVILHNVNDIGIGSVFNLTDVNVVSVYRLLLVTILISYKFSSQSDKSVNIDDANIVPHFSKNAYDIDVGTTSLNFVNFPFSKNSLRLCHRFSF